MSAPKPSTSNRPSQYAALQTTDPSQRPGHILNPTVSDHAEVKIDINVEKTSEVPQSGPYKVPESSQKKPINPHKAPGLPEQREGNNIKHGFFYSCFVVFIRSIIYIIGRILIVISSICMTVPRGINHVTMCGCICCPCSVMYSCTSATREGFKSIRDYGDKRSERKRILRNMWACSLRMDEEYDYLEHECCLCEGLAHGRFLGEDPRCRFCMYQEKEY